MTFTESLDLCLRSSLPLLFFAMTVLALSLAMSSAAPSGASSRGLFHWGRNATESVVDYTKNDLLLGSQDSFFWFLVPLTGLVSVGVCVIVNYIALAVIHILCFIFSILSSRPAWVRNDDRRYESCSFSSSFYLTLSKEKHRAGLYPYLT